LGDRTQVIGRSIYETFPDMQPPWRENHVRVLAGEELAGEEDFSPCQDGRIQWVRWSMNPWWTADSRIVGVLLFAEVITDEVTMFGGARTRPDMTEVIVIGCRYARCP
jgi:hypothetical protein